jgi:hypothetical protein
MSRKSRYTLAPLHIPGRIERLTPLLATQKSCPGKLNGHHLMSLSAARATSSPNGPRRAVPAGDSYKHFETSTMDAWDPRGLDDDLALLSLDPKRNQSVNAKQKPQPGRPSLQSHSELKPPTSNSSAQAIQSSSELSSSSSRYPLPSSPLTHPSRNSLPTSASASDSESAVRLERADLKLSSVSPNKSVLSHRLNPLLQLQQQGPLCTASRALRISITSSRSQSGRTRST